LRNGALRLAMPLDTRMRHVRFQKKQISIDVQGICDFLDIVERDTALVALDGTDVRAMQTALLCKHFLREVSLETVLTYVVAECCENIHVSPDGCLDGEPFPIISFIPRMVRFACRNNQLIVLLQTCWNRTNPLATILLTMRVFMQVNLSILV